MKKLIKSSLYLTSIGLVGSVIFNILFLSVAKKCQPFFFSSVECEYTMIGLSMWINYVYIPIILISFAVVVIPGLIYLHNKIQLEKNHIALIIYSIVAFLVAKYLVHFVSYILF
jgi:hypothetical protein